MKKLILFCMFISVAGCSSETKEKPDLDSKDTAAIKNAVSSDNIYIKVSPNANYLHDFYESIKKGDLRFVGVMGYAMEIPGVEDYYDKYSKTIGVKIIEGTSDDMSDSNGGKYQTFYEEYAKNFNLMLLEYLKQQK